MQEQAELLTKETRNEGKKRGKRKEEKKEPLLKGSIRADKNQVFYEERPVKGVDIEYNGIKATMIPSCLSDELKVIFQQTNIDWEPIKNDKPKTVKEIGGIVFDEIAEIDEEHIRIRFSADTPSGFETVRDKIIAFLTSHDIKYGEKDGSVACIWVCVGKGRQTELTDEFLERLDRLRRAKK